MGRVLGLLWLCLGALAHADVLPARGEADPRMRVASYSADEVYRLYAYVGYQIDLAFEPGESFVGFAAGDIEGITFDVVGNHLFLKPRAAHVLTNLTVLTNRREYQFEYVASSRRPDPEADEVMYAVRFLYPTTATAEVANEPARTERVLAAASGTRVLDLDYWFCGNPAVKPIAASDDGVHTRLRFAAQAE